VRGHGFDVEQGWRFGHPVEEGAFAVIELVNGVRIELLTGDVRHPRRPYHDIEVHGARGRIRRAGDKIGDNLFRAGADGAWQAVRLPEIGAEPIASSYRRLLGLLQDDHSDAEHPLGAANALRGFELLMGVYESGRTRELIRPPVAQLDYPLAVELSLVG
jgi:predicted dehydrogenase